MMDPRDKKKELQRIFRIHSKERLLEDVLTK